MAAAAEVSSAPPVPVLLRVQLSAMMFLQFAIWGAWFSVLGNRLGAMGLGGSIGDIFGTMALGGIITPLFIGQIADRYFASERLLALLHLGGAGLLYWLSMLAPLPAGATAEQTAALAAQFWWIAFAYALLFNPTLALANSVAFTHLPDGQRDFPGVRVLGTIGWIAAGMMVGIGLQAFTPDPKTSELPLQLAAGLSVVMAVYSLLLPHTPPTGKSGDAFPALRAIGLLRDPSFAVFFGASFLLTIVLAFYYNYTGLFLEKSLQVKDVASTMTLGQWSEMVILPFLPWFLMRFGMKWVLIVGMVAWGVRYLIFAGTADQPNLLYIALIGVALHGVCFDFFFAAGFIHVDKEAPAEIRGSAQALFTFLTYGLAMWLGSVLSGRVAAVFLPTDGPARWREFWLVPAAGVLVALTLFAIAFRTRSKPTV